MHDESSARQRLKGLVVAQLFLGMAPLGTALLPIHGAWVIAGIWAISAVSLAQLMLLSFWVGMGGNAVIVRVLGGIVGTAYLTTWAIAAYSVSLLDAQYDSQPLVNGFLTTFLPYAASVLLSSACFLLLRRRCTELVHFSESSAKVAHSRVRFSIFHLLILISTCSLLLSLMRIARPSYEKITEHDMISFAALYILTLLVRTINSLCAAWASLSLSSPWARIIIAICIAFVLGTVEAFSLGHDVFSWWIIISACLDSVLSTAIVIASLLVVRSCGYRLIPKGEPQAAPSTPA